MKPFVKWAGGKRQILKEIIEKIKESKWGNSSTFTFYEPFVGGGVVFLTLANPNAVINDLNEELINCYRVIRDSPKELMEELDQISETFSRSGDEYFYQIRNLDKDDSYKELSNVKKAARTIFLNKTCYNGLYRVNSKGHFNTPVGRYVNPEMYSEKNIKDISEYLRNNNVQIRCGSYIDAIQDIKMNDVIYLDPPYDYENDDGFTKYQKEGFSFQDFIKLKEECDRCLEREAHVIISNNRTEKVVKLFETDSRYTIYKVDDIQTKRYINCKGDMRQTGNEIIIWGFPRAFPQANDMQKLIKLISIEDEDKIKDFEYVTHLLEVSTFRQVSYYISALKYLDIINDKKGFSPQGIELRKLHGHVFRERLARIIITKDVFEDIHQIDIRNRRETRITEISSIIIRNGRADMSIATADRRASTVRKWLSWCENVLREDVEPAI